MRPKIFGVQFAAGGGTVVQPRAPQRPPYAITSLSEQQTALGNSLAPSAAESCCRRGSTASMLQRRPSGLRHEVPVAQLDAVSFVRAQTKKQMSLMVTTLRRAQVVVKLVSKIASKEALVHVIVAELVRN
jgi:hypothetical protein